ncbi:hypothetical protein PMAYCL1PPCAC_20993 [Pristionchus mayeri]|uniref:SH2 domain-containing protein n=1 Tax=Pristionchus mayeri TaxID=1317129 RepID=A0AAN5CU34_9BILA|nr:hypothetical protein PMAYCL1PPCAC_20993 [Pristionchus mayeri]
MSSCHSVVCCAHGLPCIQGNFQAAFEGLHLSELDRRRRSENNEEQATAYTRSSTARSTTTRSSTSIYENEDSSASGKRYRSSHVSNKSRSIRDEKSAGSKPGCVRIYRIRRLRFLLRRSRGAATKVYIGIKSTEDAERIVTRATDFKMYHKLGASDDIDSLQANLPLYIVYRSTKNAARHIPIKKVVQNKRRFFAAGTSAENKKLIFESIDALVKYYKTYVQLQPQGNTGMVDVFPA